MVEIHYQATGHRVPGFRRPYRYLVTAHLILRFGDPVLRVPGAAVSRFDDQLRNLVGDLMDTLDAAPGRAGVAACQIGVSLRVFCFDVAGARGHLVNPVVTEREGEQTELEACLSLPGMAYATTRPRQMTVEGFDQWGQPVTVSGAGDLARALAHETDHLDGRLYLDRLTGDSRRRAAKMTRRRFSGR
jgi:peptide deformylase